MAPQAEIKIKADPSQLPTGLRAALKMVQGFVHQTTGMMDPRKHKDPDHRSLAFGSFVGNLASGLVMRGIDKLHALGSEVFDFNDKLVRFGIAARIGGGALQQIGASIRQAAVDTGVSADEVLRGARAYVDLAGASQYTDAKMRTLARSAQASGTDIGDMATVVYGLQHGLHVTDAELEDTIGGLINLSKDGAVHFNQMAQEIISLAPQFSDFGITGRKGAIQLAAQLEVVRSGFGTVSEAATGLRRVYRSLPQHEKLFRQFGIQIYKPGSKKDLREFEDILGQIKNSKLFLDRTALIKATGRGEAERSLQLLFKLADEYEDLKTKGEVNGIVQQDLATYTESAAGRMKIAYEKVKNAIAEALTPERVDAIVSGIEKIAEAVGPVVDAVGKFADLLGDAADLMRQIKGYTVHDSIAQTNPWRGAHEAEDRMKKEYIEPTDAGLAKVKLARIRSQNESIYEATTREILDKQADPYGKPTEASVRKAIELSKTAGNYGESAVAVTASTDKYLEHVSKALLEHVRKQIADEEFAKTPRGQAMQIYNRLHPDQPLKIEVQVDGNTIAKSSDNANNHRRK